MNEEELREAKELLKILENDHEWYKEDYTDEALNIIYQYDETGEFMDEYTLDELTKHEAESGAVRVMFFLGQAEPNAPFGYKLDGYGNARNVERADILLALEDIIKNNEE